jgi:hypothetical protein
VYRNDEALASAGSAQRWVVGKQVHAQLAGRHRRLWQNQTSGRKRWSLQKMKCFANNKFFGDAVPKQFEEHETLRSLSQKAS